MRRLVALLLLSLLPFQFAWAVVGPYWGHETQTEGAHAGHHHHHHHHAHAAKHGGPQAQADTSTDASADAVTDDAAGQAIADAHHDCSHCHGTCSLLLNLPPALPGAPSAMLHSATPDETSGGHAPTRPERPQWLSLA